MGGFSFGEKGSGQCRAGMMLLLLLLLWCSLFGCGQESVKEKTGEEKTEVVFIHNNPCESCDEEGRFREILDEAIREKNIEISCRVRSYYAYREDGRKMTEQAVEYFGLDQGDVLYPVVVIGDHYLLGYDQIRQELGSKLEAVVASGMVEPMPDGKKDEQERHDINPVDQDSWEMVLDAGEGVIQLLYFHTEICPKCEKAEETLEQLPKQVVVAGQEYPIVITTLSVAEEENALFFGALAGQYRIPEREQQVPIVFLGERYLSGENQIREHISELLESGEGIGAVYRAGKMEVQEENVVIFLIKTIGVGFLNGFNPCALSLVLLFFSLIAALPKGCLRYGLGFLAGKLLAYVVLGLAAATAMSAIPFEAFALLRKGINLILLVFCLALAYGNFQDCFHAFRGEYGKIKVQLPGKLRTWNDRLVKRMAGNSGKKAFLLLVFGGGMAIALGEFFCTGQIYLASILQWIQRAENDKIPVLALFLYSGALCLPSLVLLVLIVRGKSAVSLADKSLKGMPLIKLCNGILFVIFAVLAVIYF